VVVHKEIIYYTDNRLDKRIMNHCQYQLLLSGLPIVSSSLNSPIDFGRNKVYIGKRGYLSLFKQIVDCLERSVGDVVFFCEHDVAYHPSHFEFTPEKDRFYYNNHVWKWNGVEAVKYDSRWLSQMCCNRKIALSHFVKKVEHEIKKDLNHNRSEPGTRGNDIHKTETWESPFPNIDLRHGKNLTGVSRFKPEDFRGPVPKNFIKKDSVPSYGDIL